MGLEGVRLVVVYLMEIHSDIGGALLVGRSLDLLEAAPLGQVGNAGGHVVPVFAAIARDLHYAVIGSHPDDLGINGGDGDRQDAVKGFCAAQIKFNGPATALLLALVITGEIRADGLPVGSGIGGLEQNIAADIDLVSVSVGDGNGRGPIKAIL